MRQQRFLLVLIPALAVIEGDFIQSTNHLDNPEEPFQSRYASGENAQIVAQYSETASRDIPISNPLFYGFFYGYNISSSLRLISEKYLSLSYDGVPEFTRWLDKAMLDSNISDPFAYYQKPLDPETGRMDPYFHTTAKFCGRKDCLDYWNKSGKKYLGKRFDMHLVGLFFTNRTFGLRVKLTREEQSIFEVDERSNTFQAAVETNHHFENRSDLLEPVGHVYEGYFHSHQEKVESHPLYPGIHFVPQDKDFHPTESKAHVTLGCGKDVSPEQTGLDLLEIIDLEISGGVYHRDFNIGGGDLPSSTLRQFGGGDQDGDEMEQVFVIYPNEKMVTDATFSVYL